MHHQLAVHQSDVKTHKQNTLLSCVACFFPKNRNLNYIQKISVWKVDYLAQLSKFLYKTRFVIGDERTIKLCNILK